MTDPNLSEHIERVRAAQPSRAELSADAHEEAREAAVSALRRLPVGYDEYRADELVRVVLDAYLEALNAH